MRRRLSEAIVRIGSRRADADAPNLPHFERSLRPLLSAASFVYGALLLARRAAYKAGVLSRIRLPVPVISVGNLTWGGNGKTPMVEFLAWSFLRAGVKPIILTRGYGGGDEARLLRKHFEGFPARVGVGADRAKIALSILAEDAVLDDHRSSVAILDDGMQHLRVERDFEIVMVNAVSGFGNEKLIPAGPLRESPSSLNRAHLVVIHHANLVSEDSLESIEASLRKYTDCPFLHSEMEAKYFSRPINANERIPLTAVQGAFVLCVSGLGCPESLALSVGKIGARRVERLDYMDHHAFSKEDMLRVQRKVAAYLSKADCRPVLVVTSEKDYMRDPAAWSNQDVLVLHSSLKLVNANAGIDDTFLSKVRPAYEQSIRTSS